MFNSEQAISRTTHSVHKGDAKLGSQVLGPTPFTIVLPECKHVDDRLCFRSSNSAPPDLRDVTNSLHTHSFTTRSIFFYLIFVDYDSNRDAGSFFPLGFDAPVHTRLLLTFTFLYLILSKRPLI